MIYHICHLSLRPTDGDKRVAQQECKTLAEADFEVSLLGVGLPDGSEGGVRTVGIAVPKSRFLRHRKIRKALLQQALQIDAGLYHLHEPALFGIGKKLKANGKFVLYTSHRDEPKARLARHWLPQFLRKIPAHRVRQAENRTLVQFDGLVATTTALRQRFLAFHSAVVEVSDAPKTWHTESKKLLVLYRKLASKEKYGYQ